MRLTQLGADLMRRAWKTKGLDAAALAVPYGNLASMHEELGHAAEAKQFASLAAQSEAATRAMTARAAPQPVRRRVKSEYRSLRALALPMLALNQE